MHDNPAQDWQALTENYRMMLDGELEKLAADSDDLTEVAKQVLRNELSNRGLPPPGIRPVISVWPESPGSQRLADGVDAEADVSRSGDVDEEDEDGVINEFTWKTLLCECDTTDQANQIREMLRREHIESWVQTPGTFLSISSPRVMVAADQLEEATRIAERPIPQEIIDDFKMETPEYESPRCPACGAEDPVLENAEPTNSWLCEVCGKQWKEPTVDAMGELGTAAR